LPPPRRFTRRRYRALRELRSYIGTTPSPADGTLRYLVTPLRLRGRSEVGTIIGITPVVVVSSPRTRYASRAERVVDVACSDGKAPLLDNNVYQCARTEFSIACCGVSGVYYVQSPIGIIPTSIDCAMRRILPPPRRFTRRRYRDLREFGSYIGITPCPIDGTPRYLVTPLRARGRSEVNTVIGITPAVAVSALRTDIVRRGCRGCYCFGCESITPYF
jgi:hypothetical protein